MRYCLFLVFLIPILMHLHRHVTPLEVQIEFNYYNYELDIFNWFKNEFLYAITGISLLAFFIKDIQFKAVSNIYKYLILASSAILVISACFSSSFEVSWLGMPNYLEGAFATLCYYILFFIAACTSDFDKLLPKAMKLITSLVFIACTIQFIGYNLFLVPGIDRLILGDALGSFTIGANSWPLYGTLMNSNVLGTFAALVYPYFLARKNWIFVTISLLLAVGSQSRGAYVAIAIVTFFIFINQKRSFLKIIVPIAIFIAAAFGMQSRYGRFHWFDTGTSQRAEVWTQTIKMMGKEVFLVGNGPGVYALNYPQDKIKESFRIQKPEGAIIDRPHNFYLNTIYSTGIISLFLLLGLFGKFFFDASSRNKLIPISAAMLSYLINLFFTDSCTSVAPLFWVMFGVGVNLIHEN